MNKLLRQPTLAVAFCFVMQAASPGVQIPIEKYKLPNGMRVVLSRDVAVPVVTVCVAYDVGARSETEGHTGFAHLFEHMMFEGSANVKRGLHPKYIQENGGTLNGSTHPDYTDYYETLPSNKLGLALWLESDRMRSLAVTDENLTNQKNAVKEERRLRFDNAPYTNAMVQNWPALAYGNFHNAHPLIGSFEDLSAASTADVAKFFKTYYAPNNAVLVIAGDFQVADAKNLVAQYFGSIAAQPQPPHPDLTEVPRAEGKTSTYLDQHARVPALIIGWPAPTRHSPAWYALNMLDAVLNGGGSSRFQLDLVKGKQSILQAQSGVGFPFQDPSDFREPGVYAALLVYKPSFQGQQIVDQVQEEVDRIAKEGIDAQELDRVKNVMRLSQAMILQTSSARARLIAQYEILDGKPELAEQDLAILFSVTPAQIQDAAKHYLTSARRDVLFIQPAQVDKAAGEKQ